MTFSISKLQKEGNNFLADKRAFYDALNRAEPLAIRTLADKISFDAKQATLRAGFTAEDAEELINDAVVITISKIRNQTFLFEDISPAAYANAVVKKLLANRIRTKKPAQQGLEDNTLLSDLDADTYLKNKELEVIIGKLFDKLEENCRQLLRLKYFDNLRDKEIVEQKLTPYSSTTSLKSKRSQCLDKLTKIAKESGILRDY